MLHKFQRRMLCNPGVICSYFGANPDSKPLLLACGHDVGGGNVIGLAVICQHLRMTRGDNSLSV